MDKPSKVETLKSPSKYAFLDKALNEKHIKANEFINKVMLIF